MILICPNCNKKTKIADENMNSKLRCGHCKEIFKGTHSVKEIDDSNFSVIKNSKLSLIVFYSDSCPHCIGVKKSLLELSKEYGEKIILAQLNTSFYQREAMNLGIRGVPNIFIFRNGTQVENIPGAIPKFQLENIIKRELKA